MMWRRANFLFVFVLVARAGAQSQSAPQVPATVSSYEGKTYFLRSLCGDSKLEFESDGRLNGPCKHPFPFTLDAVHISTIKLKGDKLLIEGDKTGVYLVPVNHENGTTTHETQTVSLKQNVKLTIRAPGGAGHAEEEFAAALRAIFAATYAELAPAGPPIEEAYASAPHIGPALALEYEGKVYSSKDGVTDPKLLYSIEPEFSQEAREKRINGEVLLKLVVTPDGRPANIRVLRGIGSGLDEQAVAAVMKYKFKPAEKDGEPVAVQIAVSVNFHIYK